MSTQDFDLESLANYLHLPLSKVQRMAERGHIPGRKVAGQWRFAAGEIYQWLEERIGAAEDDVALQNMEEALEQGVQEPAPVVISQLLRREAIEPQLTARTRSSVIEAMTELAARTGLLWDPAAMARAVRNREALQSTALENGVALLHPRRPMPALLAEPLVALGRTSTGIPFGGPSGCLTDLFFLICSVNDRDHLRTLARLSRLINLPGFLPELRSAADAEAMWQTVAMYEAQLTS
jgi:PTS system nitrogen regulatory IIA component